MAGRVADAPTSHDSLFPIAKPKVKYRAKSRKNISVPPDRQSAARDRQDISSVNVHTTQFPGGEVRGEVRVVP
jgi:hypothetical protein